MLRPATWATMRQAVGVGLVEQAQHVAPHVGCLVGLVQVHADRLPGERGDLAHPRPLVAPAPARDRARTGTRRGPRGAMAAAMPSSSRSSACVPGTSSPSLAWCIGVRLVLNPNAPARSASSTRRAIAAMSSSVAGSFAGAALAHHVGAQRAVADLRADVHHARHLLEHVEVLGVASPSPT